MFGIDKVHNKSYKDTLDVQTRLASVAAEMCVSSSGNTKDDGDVVNTDQTLLTKTSETCMDRARCKNDVLADNDENIVSDCSSPGSQDCEVSSDKENYYLNLSVDDDSDSNSEDFSSEDGFDSDEQLDMGAKKKFQQFYFESDHIALRKNKDYQLLLRTMVVLEAQRAQAIQDYQKLHKLRDDALSDPLQFVQKLQAKSLEAFPNRCEIAKLPDIDWMKYTKSSPNSESIPSSARSMLLERDSALMKQLEDSEKHLEGDSDSKLASKGGRAERWTSEEQQRFEKLLLVYPPEEVESRRWVKIARALGNRTPRQVASRSQKYFLKLAKANLPIPGRGPTAVAIRRKGQTNALSFKNSSFFPSWRPEVKMEEEEVEECPTNPQVHNNSSDEFLLYEQVPEKYRHLDEYKELEMLLQLKREQTGSRENVPGRDTQTDRVYTTFEQKQFKYNYLDPNCCIADKNV